MSLEILSRKRYPVNAAANPVVVQGHIVTQHPDESTQILVGTLSMIGNITIEFAVLNFRIISVWQPDQTTESMLHGDLCSVGHICGHRTVVIGCSCVAGAHKTSYAETLVS